jgi:uncharacterized Zn finger protein
MHYVLGEAFDRDPFLLFELRGRTRDQVLAALARLRTGTAEGALPRERATEVAATSVEVALDAFANYEVPPVTLPTLRFNFEPPQMPAAILRSINPPRPWSLEQSPADLFADLYAAASERARKIALGMVEPIAAPPARVIKRKRRASKVEASSVPPEIDNSAQAENGRED